MGWVLLSFPLFSTPKEVANDKYIDAYKAFSVGPDVPWADTC